MYPKLIADEDKMHRGIIQAISSAKHFAWVSEQDENVTGALIALVSPNLWAQRSNCIVALWISQVVGDGRKMMKELIEHHNIA